MYRESKKLPFVSGKQYILKILTVEDKIVSIQWKWYIGWLYFILSFLMNCCSVLNMLGWLPSDLVRSE